jgi:hypothetical protein
MASPKPSAKKQTTKQSRLPHILGSRRVAVLLVFILAFATFGSYRLYTSRAAGRPSIHACYQFRNSLVLRQGVTGQAGCVMALQSFLNRDRMQRGIAPSSGWPNLQVDGDFGPKTKQAVLAFQLTLRKAGVSIGVDGVVGRETWLRIYNECVHWGSGPRGMTAFCGIPREAL